MKLANQIKKKAKQIGFDLVGITSTEPFYHAYQVLEERKARGILPDYTTEDIELRTTPRLHLPTAKTIIALAMSYASSRQNYNDEGEIALYARGKDYHQVIQEKMDELIDYLKEFQGDVETKVFIDTGPLLDREIAFRAGLGWIGKNNNLINPHYGSYLVLGEILTNLDLAIDEPMTDKCGDCQLCLQSCPGKALEKPYYLNPDKCISNLTQRKGILSVQDRKKIEKKLWGCDICLEVCPYNQDIPTDLHPEFFPFIQGDLIKILSFTKNTFIKEWGYSALAWRGLRTLKRNALIIMGNKGNNKYLSLIEKELVNSSSILRVYAVWALGEIGDHASKEKIIKLYKVEKDVRVLHEIKEVFKKTKWGELDD